MTTRFFAYTPIELSTYHLCRADGEVHVRTLMLSGIPQLLFQSPHSEDFPLKGQLEVCCDLITSRNSLLHCDRSSAPHVGLGSIALRHKKEHRHASRSI